MPHKDRQERLEYNRKWRLNKKKLKFTDEQIYEHIKNNRLPELLELKRETEIKLASVIRMIDSANKFIHLYKEEIRIFDKEASKIVNEVLVNQ